MMVSPSNPQSVVVAVASNDNGLYEVVALVLTLRYKELPSSEFKVIIEPMVKYADEDSGPSLGAPP